MTSVWSRLKAMISGAPSRDEQPASRHDRREAGRERHRETGEPAWEASDQLESPDNQANPDAAPEILGGS